MAVGANWVGHTGSFVAGGTYTTSLTLAGGSNQILVVGIAFQGVIGALPKHAVTGVKFGGQSLTWQAASSSGARITPDDALSIWYLVNPPTGSAQTLEIDTTSSSDRLAADFTVFTGVDTHNPFDSVSGDIGGNGTSSSDTLNLTYTGEGIYSLVFIDGTGFTTQNNLTATTGISDSTDGVACAMGHATVAAKGNYTFGYGMPGGSTETYEQLDVALQPPQPFNDHLMMMGVT